MGCQLLSEITSPLFVLVPFVRPMRLAFRNLGEVHGGPFLDVRRDERLPKKPGKILKNTKDDSEDAVGYMRYHGIAFYRGRF